MSKPDDKPASVRIYLPKDLREWWHNLPRFERSQIAAEALRAWRDRVVDPAVDPKRPGAAKMGKKGRDGEA